jgi:hypothetical protein
MRGPAPRIHLEQQSIQVMDCRVKPGKDIRTTFVERRGFGEDADCSIPLRQRRLDIRRSQDAPENAASRSSF